MPVPLGPEKTMGREEEVGVGAMARWCGGRVKLRGGERWERDVVCRIAVCGIEIFLGWRRSRCGGTIE